MILASSLTISSLRFLICYNYAIYPERKGLLVGLHALMDLALGIVRILSITIIFIIIITSNVKLSFDNCILECKKDGREESKVKSNTLIILFSPAYSVIGLGEMLALFNDYCSHNL